MHEQWMQMLNDANDECMWTKHIDQDVKLDYGNHNDETKAYEAHIQSSIFFQIQRFLLLV